MELDLTFQLAVAVVSLLSLGLIRRQRLSPLGGVGLASALIGVASGVFAHDMFHGMRLLAWVLFLHLPLWLGFFAFIWRKVPLYCVSALTAGLLLLGTALYAFRIEPFRLQTTTYALSVPRLETPLRVAILADVQTDEVGAYEERVFDAVAALAPDLVLLPGDFLQVYGAARAEQVTRFKQLLGKLSPRLGIWAVPGNVDPPGSAELFAVNGARYLEQTQVVQVNHEISLLGLNLEDSFNDRINLPKSDTTLRIVLGHAPDFSLGSTDNGTQNLFVAGHTHGGQVQLPLFGPLLTLSKVPRSWGGGGLTRLSAERTLLVSRGIGLERGFAPRLRFLCPPEIVVLNISGR